MYWVRNTLKQEIYMAMKISRFRGENLKSAKLKSSQSYLLLFNPNLGGLFRGPFGGGEEG